MLVNTRKKPEAHRRSTFSFVQVETLHLEIWRFKKVCEFYRHLGVFYFGCGKKGWKTSSQEWEDMFFVSQSSPYFPGPWSSPPPIICFITAKGVLSIKRLQRLTWKFLTISVASLVTRQSMAHGILAVGGSECFLTCPQQLSRPLDTGTALMDNRRVDFHCAHSNKQSSF